MYPTVHIHITYKQYNIYCIDNVNLLYTIMYYSILVYVYMHTCTHPNIYMHYITLYTYSIYSTCRVIHICIYIYILIRVAGIFQNIIDTFLQFRRFYIWGQMFGMFLIRNPDQMLRSHLTTSSALFLTLHHVRVRAQREKENFTWNLRMSRGFPAFLRQF